MIDSSKTSVPYEGLKPAAPSVWERFIEAQKEFSSVAKLTEGYGYKYADISSVIAAILPALHKHGLALVQNTTPNENGVMVETRVFDDKGNFISGGQLFMPQVAGMEKVNVTQRFGAALTYARRYSLLTFFGIGVEDTDGVPLTGKNGYQREEVRTVDITPDLRAKATAAAQQGMESYKKFFMTLAPAIRAAFRSGEHPLHDEMKAIAQKVSK